MKDHKKTNSNQGRESRRSFLKTAAATAAVAGAAGCLTPQGDHSVPQDEADLHICKGLNTVTQDEKGPGTCDCATAPRHSCAGGNHCAGLGGCGTLDYSTQYWVGDNQCGKSDPDSATNWDGTGGCGTPIGAGNTGFPETQLNNAVPTPGGAMGDTPTSAFIGVPVWAIARARFEQKMVKRKLGFKKAKNVKIGDFPSNSWNPIGKPYDRGALPDPYPEPMPTPIRPPLPATKKKS
jgi:hypothetical protein